MYKSSDKGGFQLILGLSIFRDSEFFICTKHLTFILQMNCYFVDKISKIYWFAFSVSLECFFYVLLIVHLSIILVINQLNAQNLVL